MKSITIKGSQRQNPGKKEARQIRSLGNVPCILYGGTEHVNFSAPTSEFKGLVYSPDVHTVSLNIDGKEYNAVMKEIQFHPVSDKILHIDFLALSEDKPVVMDIPIKVSGVSPGVRKGGQMLTKLRKLKVKALPANLPDKIAINIDTLDIGDSIKVSDIKLKGVEVLDSARNVIVAVKTARAVVEEVVAAPATTAAAAPAAEGAKADDTKAAADAGKGKAEPAKGKEPAKK